MNYFSKRIVNGFSLNKKGIRRAPIGLTGMG